MTWYAVYDERRGTLLSTGTVLADPMPAGVTAVALAGPPDWQTHAWNPTARAFDPRVPEAPPPSAAELIMEQPEVVAMTAETRTAVRVAADRVLGTR